MLGTLLAQRIHHYKTDRAYDLLQLINKRYKDTFDKDNLLNILDKSPVFKLSHIFSRSFTSNDFTSLSEDFEKKISDILVEKDVNTVNLLLDMLLLIDAGDKVQYQYKDGNNQNNMNDMVNNFMNTTKFKF